MTIIVPVPITALPTPPSTSDPINFDTRADAFMLALPGFATATNSIANASYYNASDAAASASTAISQVSLASSSASTATTQAGIATTKAAEAVISAADAAASATTASSAGASAGAAAAGAIAWVSGTTYTAGFTVYSPINLRVYRRKLSGVSTIDPSLDVANWVDPIGGIHSTITSTTSTTLTSTPTLLQITPSGYGVTVTLPDATTCQLGGPLHAIDNSSAYTVRVVNNTGTLLGFVPANTTAYISLADKTTAAGAWSSDKLVPVGIAGELTTSNFRSVSAVVDIGTNREVLIGFGASGIYGVVFDRNTGVFGSAVLIRSGTFTSSGFVAGLSAANQVLVASCPSASTAFQAVTLSVSGTAITVNTAATATLGSNITGSGFSVSGLVSVGSSFACSYQVTTSSYTEMRAMTVSGTTVTVGAAYVVPGYWSSQVVPIFAEGSVLLLAGSDTGAGTTTFFAYSVSGVTLTTGTNATRTGTAGQTNVFSMVRLGTGRYCVVNTMTNTQHDATVMTLTGTVVTLSNVTIDSSGSGVNTGVLVGTNKVLYTLNTAPTTLQLVTDTSGTASVGSLLWLNSGQVVLPMVIGTTVHALGASTLTTGADVYTKIDCSAASPVITSAVQYALGQTTYSGFGGTGVNNYAGVTLKKATNLIYGGTSFQQIAPPSPNSTGVVPFMLRLSSGVLSTVPPTDVLGILANGSQQIYAGRSDAERWACLAHSTTYSGIRKLESVV